MFLAAIAWGKGGGRGGEENFNIKESNCLLLKKIFFSVIC